MPRGEGDRWLWLASRVAAFLWDDEAWDVLSARFVGLARATELLLLGEQGRDGGTGLGGGEDTPGGDGELPGDHGIGGGKGEAFGGELAG